MREGLECVLFEAALPGLKLMGNAKSKEERRKVDQEEQKRVECRGGYVRRKS